MGHPSLRWNVSEDQGLAIIHQTLLEVLREQPKQYLPIHDLVFRLNQRGRHRSIHTRKKHNCLTKYIKCQYGGLTHFLKDYPFYEVHTREGQLYIHFVEEKYEPDLCKRGLTRDHDWVLV
jgi:hypothetical protein